MDKLSNDGAIIIEPGSELGKKFKFTKDKFSGYLCLLNNEVWISAIVSLKPGKHNLTHLFNRISKLGYTIKVPSPMPRMEEICKHMGFTKTVENFPEAGEDIDVWVMEP